MRVLAIDGSPVGDGRTRSAITAVAEAAAASSAGTVDVRSAVGEAASAVAAAESADCFVFGTPVYRAGIAWPLKEFLDRLPRGMWGEKSDPLRGKAVAIVATGATLHHFLALDGLRNIVAGFFAAHVIPPGLYVPAAGYDADGTLGGEATERAAAQGRALAELTSFLRQSTALRALTPHA